MNTEIFIFYFALSDLDLHHFDDEKIIFLTFSKLIPDNFEILPFTEYPHLHIKRTIHALFLMSRK